MMLIDSCCVKAPSQEPRWVTIGGYLLLALLVLRVMLMIWLPLTDTTEARYAEIARKMLETGNWVTPLHDYGVPFWAKPPLSTWSSALSMAVFGQREWSARLPSLLFSLGTLGLVVRLAYLRYGKEAAMTCALILASGALFFATSATVMTDAALVFCTTLMAVAFWRSLHESSRHWPYLFFIGAGLGLLAKGPIALVLSGLPIFVWVLVRRQWPALWQRLPWIKGSLLTLLIAAPWYVWAEIRTPGFLHYFIVGEHIQRFLDSGWNGDRYGFAHATPHGMIWLYALVGFLPWSLLVPWWLWRRQQTCSMDGWRLFLLLWSTLPLVFFTCSSNIIVPYAMPVLPAAALLMTDIQQGVEGKRPGWSLLGFASVILLAGIVLFGLLQGEAEKRLRTQKDVIAHWQALHPAPGSRLLYWGRREFSAEFYSAGRAHATSDLAELRQLLTREPNDVLVLDIRDFFRLSIEAYPPVKLLDLVHTNGRTLMLLGTCKAKCI